MSESDDIRFMQRCLQLAANGKPTCSPNPMVGAVVVHDGAIIGEGWHRKAGEPHAEPNAIRSVRDPSLLVNSTLYVSLEPCSHYGKTPPCVELILKVGIPRVVVGSLDPFPLVAGRGVARLQEAGVQVKVGVLTDACQALNRSYLHFLHQQRPWVILKWAQTADGFMDRFREPGDGRQPLKISTPFTQMLTHKLRSECDAILVGTNTALLDDPSLNVRYWTGQHPLRVVLDRRGILPPSSRLLDGSLETIVFTETRSGRVGRTRWIRIDFDQDVLGQVLRELHCIKVQTLLVEGGAQLHRSFLASGLWDEIHVEESSLQVGDGVAAPRPGDLPDQWCSIHSGNGPYHREIRHYGRIQ